MSSDDRTLLANLRREREQLSKSKMPASDEDKIQRALDLAVADMQVLVAIRGALTKGIEEQKAKSKALASALKTLRGKFHASADHRSQALKALSAARNAVKDAEPALSRVTKALQDLNMNLLDFGPFQDVDGA